VLGTDDVDHNPRTLRSLPLAFHGRPARRGGRRRLREVWAGVLAVAAVVAAAWYWLRPFY